MEKIRKKEIRRGRKTEKRRKRKKVRKKCEKGNERREERKEAKNKEVVIKEWKADRNKIKGAKSREKKGKR